MMGKGEKVPIKLTLSCLIFECVPNNITELQLKTIALEKIKIKSKRESCYL